jgi:hypothetical protein
MYIPHHGQQAINRDVVNDALRRSEERRALRERKTATDTGRRAGKSALPLTDLVRSMFGGLARPS